MYKSCPTNMVIFVFVVDTSASMNQRTSVGTTLLDVAKNAVETFTKLRQRDQTSRTDRYMLVTLEEPPGAVKAGWRENQATFMNELKNLQATGLSTLGTSLKEAFDLLNLYRLHSGIDNYGMGRNPFYVEPAMVICITDGSKLSSQSAVQEELQLPMHTMLPGHELTNDPFRWDQRLFSIILRMPGTRSSLPNKIGMQSGDPAIAVMCEVTGGRCYKVSSSKSLGQALESLAQKVQCGVVLNFEKIGGASNPPPPPHEVLKLSGNELRDTDSPTPPLPMHNRLMNNMDYSKEDVKDKNSLPDENHVALKTEGVKINQAGDNPSATSNSLHPEDNLGVMGISRSATSSPGPQAMQTTAWMSCRRMIFIKSNPPVGHWPVPESFWPDPSMQSLPPRDAQPSVMFSCNNSEPLVLDNLPFDKYELEPSPLTQYILERKSPSTCWQTFIVNSSKKLGDIGCPFGYLKASSNLQTVNLFVMPYNFPVLFPVIDELVKVHKMKPTTKWKEKFDNYLSAMPNYYAGPLRNAFRRMGIPPAFVPDHLDSFLSYTVVNYLKKVKQQSKMETERLISLVGKNATRDAVPRPLMSVRTPQLPKERKKDFRALLHSSNFSVNNEDNRIAGETDINIPSASFHNTIKQNVRTQSYKNPFDISRDELLDQVSRMRINFFHTAATSTRLQDEDARHSVAIADMGNYQEVLRQLSPLREVDPGQNRVHMFGNPFKLAKDQRVMVDEADVNEAMAGPRSGKRPLIANRPGSPRDKKRQQETPPVRWPNKTNQNGGSPLPLPLNNKVPPDKNVMLQDGKINSVFSGHGIKRKNNEGSEGANKMLKASKGLIKPQLAKLQQRIHNKGKANCKQQSAAKSDGNALAKNDFVSSILKEAVTSQSKTFSGQGVPVVNSHDNSVGKDKLTNSETKEPLLDGLTKGRAEGLSPRSLKKQLLREAWEENRLIKNLVFRDIRQPEKSDDVVLSRITNLKGSLEVQSAAVQEIIEEAELFKKKALIERLSSHLETLQQRLSPDSTDAKLAKKKR
ncbi:integrator complex subunit 6-like [Montipora foliosa]|uniref:integrator complex subunit 6-like n=1 Tax=Montipora foliosa TaxID=591990 RepID=UPI0035F2168F